jgi:hypothetical protein
VEEMVFNGRWGAPPRFDDRLNFGEKAKENKVIVVLEVQRLLPKISRIDLVLSQKFIEIDQRNDLYATIRPIS